MIFACNQNAVLYETLISSLIIPLTYLLSSFVRIQGFFVNLFVDNAFSCFCSLRVKEISDDSFCRAQNLLGTWSAMPSSNSSATLSDLIQRPHFRIFLVLGNRNGSFFIHSYLNFLSFSPDYFH